MPAADTKLRPNRVSRTVVDTQNNGVAVVALVSGERRRRLPDQATEADIANRIYEGGPNVAYYLQHFRPEVDAMIWLPTGKSGTNGVRVVWPLGGGALRNLEVQNPVQAMLASFSPLAMTIDVWAVDDEKRAKTYPLLEVALECQALGDLRNLRGQFAELDLGTPEGAAKARARIGLTGTTAPDTADRSLPATRAELVQGAGTIVLPETGSVSDEPAFRVANFPGIGSRITCAELASLRLKAIEQAIAFCEQAGPDWRDKIMARCEAYRKALAAAFQTLSKAACSLQASWLGLAQLQHSASCYSKVPLKVADIACGDLLVTGNDRISRADRDDHWFQEDLFAALAVPPTEHDLLKSVSMIVLLEPVQTLGELEIAGVYADRYLTMVYAPYAAASVKDLQSRLRHEPFEKGAEDWKRSVAVVASTLEVQSSVGPIAVPAVAAVVARAVEVKSHRAGRNDFAGEAARTAVGQFAPLIQVDSLFTAVQPTIRIKDMALRKDYTRNLVTLVEDAGGGGLVASDQETLFANVDSPNAAYAFTTTTHVRNQLVRSIRHHVHRYYLGQPATQQVLDQIEADINGHLDDLDSRSLVNSRKVIKREQTEVNVGFSNDGRGLEISLKVGVPSTISYADVKSALYVIPMSVDETNHIQDI